MSSAGEKIAKNSENIQNISQNPLCFDNPLVVSISSENLNNNKNIQEDESKVDCPTDNLDNSVEMGAQRSFLYKFGGIALTLASCLFYSLALIIVKILKDKGHHGFSCTFWRYFGSFLIAIPIALFFQFGRGKKNISIFAEIWPLTEPKKRNEFFGILMRGLLGSLTTLSRFWALKFLTMSDVTSVSYSYILLVAILAHFLLKEPLGFIQVFSALLAIFGVFVISRPPLLTGESEFNHENMIGIGITIGSTFFHSFTTILTRKLRKVNFICLDLLFGLIGSIVGLTLALSFGVFKIPQEATEIILIIGISFFSFIGATLIILAYKFENAGPIAVARSSDTIYAFILQFIILGIIPDIYSVIGGTIIISSVFVTGFFKWISTLPKESKVKNCLKFILK